MSIFMLGIDHNMAPVDVRAQFAFTRKNTGEALHRLKEEAGICGCIILSTCNRLELWVSTADEEKPDLYQWLCSLKGVQGEQYQKYFTSRENEEAVEHLFYLTSGLNRIQQQPIALSGGRDGRMVSMGTFVHFIESCAHIIAGLGRLATTSPVLVVGDTRRKSPVVSLRAGRY